MGYPCHVQTTTQLAVTMGAGLAPPINVYESTSLAVEEAAQLYDYGLTQSTSRWFAGANAVTPDVNHISTYKFKLDAAIQRFTLYNPTPGKVEVTMYEFTPREDMPMLTRWYSGADTLGLYSAIIATSSSVSTNVSGDNTASGLLFDDTAADNVNNQVTHGRFPSVKHYLKKVHEKKFCIEAGQELKVTTSYTPSRWLNGWDLRPQIGNAGTSPLGSTGQGTWMFRGLSRVIWFIAVGSLVPNGTDVSETRWAPARLVVRQTSSYHFVAPQFTEPSHYSSYLLNTIVSSSSGAKRTMLASGAYDTDTQL